MPKVSVLMPIYNTREEHLRPAMESVLTQTFRDFEFLILNDSPDNAALDAIVASYDDPRIRYFRNDANIGISHSRNKLIDLARGEYLAVMDHDDVSLPPRLEKQVAYLDGHPDVGVVGTQSAFFTKPIRPRPVDDADIRVALIRSCAITHPSSMIRKSVLLDHGIRYEDGFSPAEDYALWCRLIPHTRFHNLDEVLFKYREHEGNTFKTQKARMDARTAAIHAFVEVDNPALYREHLYRAEFKARYRLFGLLPIVTVKSRADRTRIYLFDVIPLLSIRRGCRFQP